MESNILYSLKSFNFVSIDLNTLRTVLAVAESAGYTRAAQKLHITQPAVSRRLVALEQRLRTKLFRREGHRFLATEAGLEVCDRARQVLALVDNLPSSVQEIAGQPSGRLALGLPSVVGEVLLPRLVRSYQAKFPDVFLMVEQGVADLSEMLVTNQVDVALLWGKPLSPMIELTPLIDHELGLVYPKAWKKRGPRGRPIRDRLSLRETAQLPLIVPSASQGMRLLIEQAYNDAGIRPNIVMEVNGYALCRSLARDGVGAIFLAETGLRDEADRAALAFAHIRDPAIRWTLSMAVRKHGRPTLAARLMMRMILDQVVDLVEREEWRGELLAQRGR
jgi:LysR family transcriptional regulator, nitrogen assimilation regulatory protein